ncbi:LOW QUALITY PROTEIN: uncharacterized protein AAES06_004019 [Glossophaga mutica]
MATRDLVAGMIFLLQTTVGGLGNLSLLSLYLFLCFTGYRLRPTDLIINNLIVANSLVLFSSGIIFTLTYFMLYQHLSDSECRLFHYLSSMGRGVSIGTTCLLSIFQAITISPMNSRWADLKHKAPKYIVPTIFLYWILQMSVNVIYLMFLSANLGNKNITHRKNFGLCSSIRHDKPADSLYAALLVFPDVVCFMLMLWANGFMVVILHRHKQRVRHLPRTHITSQSSPGSRATKAIILLGDPVCSRDHGKKKPVTNTPRVSYETLVKSWSCSWVLQFRRQRSVLENTQHGTRDLAGGMVFLLHTVIGVLGNFSLLYHYLFLYFTGYRLRFTELTVCNLVVANFTGLFSSGLSYAMSSFGWYHHFSDFRCKFFLYVRGVGRGVSIGTICLLNIIQAITVSPMNSRWAALKHKASKYIVPLVFLYWVLQMLINIIFLMYMSSSSSNKNITNKTFGYCFSVCHDRMRDSLHAVLIASPDFFCFVLMLWASGSMVFILYRHKQRVQHIHRTHLFSPSPPEVRAIKTILLLVSTFVFLNTLSSIFHILLAILNNPNWFIWNTSSGLSLSFPTVSPLLIVTPVFPVGRGVCIGTTCLLSIFQAITISPMNSRLRPTDLIVNNLMVANTLVLLSSGIHFTVSYFAWNHYLRDFGCKFFPYSYAVGRGVSIGTTCLLSIIQAITISPMKFSNLSNKNITNTKNFGYCSAVHHDKTRDSLYAALIASPDVVCFLFMLWASSSMVFILHRHKQRVRHICRTHIASQSSPESRATKTILLLGDDKGEKH